MQQTANYGLKKPETNEYYNVGDFNYNADAIDAALEGLEDGKADLDEDGKVPEGQLPAMDYVPNSEKGQPGGVATLGEDGKVPAGQLPEISNDEIITVTSAVLTDGSIVLEVPVTVRTGTLVKFTAPASGADVTGGITIAGEVFQVVDAMCQCVTGKGGVWQTGAEIAVVLDCKGKKAYLQNNAMHVIDCGVWI